ncbi:MAG: FkbM family methyltransferase [Verrucomicrobiae bacterium]
MSKLCTDWTARKARVRSFVPVSWLKTLHHIKIRLEKRMFKPHVAKQCFGDVELRLQISDPMAQDWYGRGGGFLKEIQLLTQSQLRPGARVFNVGAHQGIVALQLAHHVGPHGLVVAVEANPHNIPLARENCRLNGVRNLVVEHAVVAARSGSLPFSQEWDGQSVGRGTCRVPAITIDELSGRYGRPDVLYIDVEGYECEVLAGASGTLAHAPDLYIEVHPGCGLEDFGGSVEKVLSYLSPDTYELFAIRPAQPPDGADLVRGFDPDLSWIRERFYLVALRKADGRIGRA